MKNKNKKNKEISENTFYKCIYDYQESDFCVGNIGTVGYWRDCALYWCYNDNLREMYKYLEKCLSNEVIPTISEVWDLEFKRFN